MKQRVIFRKGTLQYTDSGRAYFGFEVIKHVAKLIRSKGIKMRIIKGDGTTSPSGLTSDIHNYIKVNRYEYNPEKNINAYIHYDEEDGQKIKKALIELELPYYWNGNTDKCIKLTIAKKQNGLVKPFRSQFK